MSEKVTARQDTTINRMVNKPTVANVHWLHYRSLWNTHKLRRKSLCHADGMRKLCSDPAKAPGCHLTLEWIEKQTGEEEKLVVEEQTQGMQGKTFLPTVESSN